MKLSNLIRKCIFISILFLPIIIQASEVEEEYSLSYALFMEAFMTMHVVFL